MKKTLTATLALTLATVSLAGSVSAQDTRTVTRAASEVTEYRFEDHAVGGDTDGPAGGIVPGRRARRRDTLVQPRIHYVNEMLKSVETL